MTGGDFRHVCVSLANRTETMILLYVNSTSIKIYAHTSKHTFVGHAHTPRTSKGLKIRRSFD